MLQMTEWWGWLRTLQTWLGSLHQATRNVTARLLIVALGGHYGALAVLAGLPATGRGHWLWWQVSDTSTVGVLVYFLVLVAANNWPRG